MRQLLESAPWPGNLIQLQSVLSSLLLSNNDDITVDHLQAILGDLRDTSAPDRPALPPEFSSYRCGKRAKPSNASTLKICSAAVSNMSRVADKSRPRTHPSLPQAQTAQYPLPAPRSGRIARLPQISIRRWRF